jgi:hypothetical protein
MESASGADLASAEDSELTTADGAVFTSEVLEGREFTMGSFG